MAYLANNDIEYITKNITPEETLYVTGIASSLYDTVNKSNISPEYSDEIIYITKLLAFVAKFNVLYNMVSEYQYDPLYKGYIGDMKYNLEDYVREIQENILSVIGIIQLSNISKIELPISDNILEILNELKICVNNFFKYILDNIEYEGCKFLTSKFLTCIHRYIYIFRLNKPDSTNNTMKKSVDYTYAKSCY